MPLEFKILMAVTIVIMIAIPLIFIYICFLAAELQIDNETGKKNRPDR